MRSQIRVLVCFAFLPTLSLGNEFSSTFWIESYFKLIELSSIDVGRGYTPAFYVLCHWVIFYLTAIKLPFAVIKQSNTACRIEVGALKS